MASLFEMSKGTLTFVFAAARAATQEIRESMATENPKPAKVAAVAELKEKLEAADAVVATEYRGLDVPQQAALRSAVSEAGGELKIYKNSLARIAANDLGIEMDELLTGPTALAFTRPGEDAPADPVALTKALQDFADENEAFVIKGGFMDGASIGADDVKALSKVPPREVMLSKLAGLFQAPMSNLASLFQAAPQQLAGLIKSLIEEKGGEAPVAAADGGDNAADEATESAAPAAEEGGDAAEASADADAGDAPTEEAADEAAAEADAEAPAEEAAAEATEDAGDSGDASEESTEEEA